MQQQHFLFETCVHQVLRPAFESCCCSGDLQLQCNDSSICVRDGKSVLLYFLFRTFEATVGSQWNQNSLSNQSYLRPFCPSQGRAFAKSRTQPRQFFLGKKKSRPNKDTLQEPWSFDFLGLEIPKKKKIAENGEHVTMMTSSSYFEAKARSGIGCACATFWKVEVQCLCICKYIYIEIMVVDGYDLGVYI